MEERRRGALISEYHRLDSRIHRTSARVSRLFLIGQISPEIAYTLSTTLPPPPGRRLHLCSLNAGSIVPSFTRLLHALPLVDIRRTSVLSAPPTRNIGLVKIPGGPRRNRNFEVTRKGREQEGGREGNRSLPSSSVRC